MRLTIEEVSNLLNLPVSTVQRWVQQGKIPVFKSEHGYVFLENDLRKWAESRRIILPSSSQKAATKVCTDTISLLSALRKGGTLYGLTADSVSGLLKKVVEAASIDGSIDRDALFVKLVEREELSTTGIGRGVAIPHPRSPLPGVLDEPSITTCFLTKPIDYGAIDGVPVFVLFLILSPSPKIHLTVLSRLSHLLRDKSFVDFLKVGPSETELLSKVETMENNMDAECRPVKLHHAF